MFERLSEPARKAIFLGKVESDRLGAEIIEPTHLLTGMLLTRRPEVQRDIHRAHGLLTDAEFENWAEADLPLGIPAVFEERLFRPLKDSIDVTGWKVNSNSKTLSRSCKAVLESAIDSAGRGQVQLNHLMTALIGCDDPYVKEQLEQAGIL